jgi:hypothetical protein
MNRNQTEGLLEFIKDALPYPDRVDINDAKISLYFEALKEFEVDDVKKKITDFLKSEWRKTYIPLAPILRTICSAGDSNEYKPTSYVSLRSHKLNESLDKFNIIATDLIDKIVAGKPLTKVQAEVRVEVMKYMDISFHKRDVREALRDKGGAFYHSFKGITCYLHAGLAKPLTGKSKGNLNTKKNYLTDSS